MQSSLKLETSDQLDDRGYRWFAIEEYKNAIYQFKEPLKPWFYVGANKSYETRMLQNLKEKMLQKGITFDFLDLIRNSKQYGELRL